MKGYRNKPAATVEVIDNEGYFHTGDVGYYDEESTFYIVERMKELIKVQGFQVRHNLRYIITYLLILYDTQPN